MRPLSLKLTAAESVLVRDIAKMLGESPSKVALDIFRLGVAHMDVDAKKLGTKLLSDGLATWGGLFEKPKR